MKGICESGGCVFSIELRNPGMATKYLCENCGTWTFKKPKASERRATELARLEGGK